MDEEGGASPEDAKKRGFLKGLNWVLLAVALPCGVLAMVRPFYEAPRHKQLFKEVKVPMPGLTLLAINTYPFVSGLLLVGAVGCGVATGIWSQRRRTVVANGAYLLLVLGWMMLFKIALALPMMIVKHEIGSPR
jgi:hypothetical protein